MRSRGQGWNKTEKFSSKRKDSRKKCERLRKLKEFFPEIYDTIMTERFVLLETTENKKGAEGMKKTKQILTLATTASLLMGSISVPAYAATTFVDINTVTWSGFKPFLNQAAELGADERLRGKRQALLQAEKQRDLLRSGAADVFHHEGIHEAGCQ